MDVIPSKKPLISFVKQAQEGKIVLPEFQRDFVWARDDIKDFLISILKGYFIGSILLLRMDSDNPPFAIRKITGVNKRPEELKPYCMILDGQQRLTSLYYVFIAPENIPLKGTKHSYKFYLKLNELVNNNVDDSVESERSDLSNMHDDINYQFDNNIVPFSKLLDWENWIKKYETRLISKTEHEQLVFYREIKPKWEAYINNFKKEIPIIVIPKIDGEDEKSISEVCSIFEKMNSTGVKLTVFDLLAARLYKFKNEAGERIDLHELWEESLKKCPLIRAFSNGESDSYGVFALRFIALKRGDEAKGKTIITLEHKDFEKDWGLAVKYLEKALEKIKETNEGGFGAIDPKWMPYSTMIPVLAALLWKTDEFWKTDRLNNKYLKYIQKWYWGSVFLERYAGAVETTTNKDYADFIKFFVEPSHVPSVFAEADREILGNPGFSLRDVFRTNSIYKGVMNLIALEGAKDFMKNQTINLDDLDDHHIFPQKYLKNIKVQEMKPKYSKDEINCILNRTLISAETNKYISSRKPSEYLQKIPSEERDSIMRSHFIGKDAIEKMESNSDDAFEEFLKIREKEILSRLREMLTIT